MLKDKKKMIQAILNESSTNFTGIIFLYYCFSTILKLLISFCLKSIQQLFISTVIVVIISLIDYMIYTYIINKSYEIVCKEKSKTYLKNSFIFALIVVLLEYIFQVFLLYISKNYIFMMSFTLALSMLRIMYIPFLHFMYYEIKISIKIFKNILKSIYLVINNIMEILYFSLLFYFSNLVHNYAIYFFATYFKIDETINIYDLILYSDKRLIFIILEILFNLILAIASSKMFIYFAYTFKEFINTKSKSNNKKRR